MTGLPISDRRTEAVERQLEFVDQRRDELLSLLAQGVSLLLQEAAKSSVGVDNTMKAVALSGILGAKACTFAVEKEVLAKITAADQNA